MNRNVRIRGGSSIAACVLLLLLASCATAPGPGISLESVRSALQAQYPDLLQTFDLHQGIFSVNDAIWDTLTRAQRSEFLARCLQARRTITGQTTVRIDTEGELVAVYDGASSVFYGTPMAAASDISADTAEDSASTAPGAEPFLLLLSLPRPVYPVEALRAGVEGTVYVQARIGADGRVQEIMPIDGGIPLLNRAAVEAARRASFRPLSGTEESESIWVRIPMHFAIPRGRQAADPRFEGTIGGVADAVILPESGRSLSPGTGK
jgi:TonB family protein